MTTPHEKILPNPDVLNEVEYGRFVLTNLAAKRAKQIKDGAPPLVRIDSNHPLSIALAEIAAGKIKPLMAGDVAATLEDDDMGALETLDIADVGLLLPAIEDDIDLTAAAVLDEELEDHDHEEEEEVVVAGLSDLLVEDAEEAAVPETEDTEISLDDLAEQEEAEEEPEAV